MKPAPGHRGDLVSVLVRGADRVSLEYSVGGLTWGSAAAVAFGLGSSRVLFTLVYMIVRSELAHARCQRKTTPPGACRVPKVRLACELQRYARC